jgi:hypothetical protein
MPSICRFLVTCNLESVNNNQLVFWDDQRSLPFDIARLDSVWVFGRTYGKRPVLELFAKGNITGDPTHRLLLQLESSSIEWRIQESRAGCLGYFCRTA